MIEQEIIIYNSVFLVRGSWKIMLKNIGFFLKKNLYPLAIPMAFFTVWLWSFPMYGPLLTITKNPNKLFLVYLISHAIGVLLYSIAADFLDLSYQNELYFFILSAILIGSLTIIFPFLATIFIIPAVIFMGFISGSLIVFYLYYLKSGSIENRGITLGLIFFIAGIISLIFLLSPVKNWMFVMNGLLLFSSLFLYNFHPSKNDRLIQLNIAKTSLNYWFILVALVAVFYIGGGIMYSLSYREILTTGNFNFNYGFLYYTLAAVPIGFFADKKGRKNLVNIGLTFAGIGFLLMFISDHTNSMALGFLQIGFAAMDIFVFLTLIDWSEIIKERRFLGIGLFLNIIIIFFSSWSLLENKAADLIKFEYIPLLGVVLMFLLIPLLNTLKETLPIDSNLNELNSMDRELEDIYNDYLLTPREKEVVELLLGGKKTSQITEILSISYNTLKTHLKNIYKKTKTSGQTELILLFWEETEKE